MIFCFINKVLIEIISPPKDTTILPEIGLSQVNNGQYVFCNQYNGTKADCEQITLHTESFNSGLVTGLAAVPLLHACASACQTLE